MTQLEWSDFDKDNCELYGPVLGNIKSLQDTLLYLFAALRTVADLTFKHLVLELGH